MSQRLIARRQRQRLSLLEEELFSLNWTDSKDTYQKNAKRRTWCSSNFSLPKVDLLGSTCVTDPQEDIGYGFRQNCRYESPNRIKGYRRYLESETYRKTQFSLKNSKEDHGIGSSGLAFDVDLLEKPKLLEEDHGHSTTNSKIDSDQMFQFSEATVALDGTSRVSEQRKNILIKLKKKGAKSSMKEVGNESETCLHVLLSRS